MRHFDPPSPVSLLLAWVPGIAALPTEEDEAFREYYLRSVSLAVSTIFVAGCGLQLWLSHSLSNFGRKSGNINFVYIGTTVLSLYYVNAAASSSEQLSRFVGIPSSALFCLTRVLRAVSLSRASADDAAQWLGLGHRDGRRTLASILSGALLAMVSAGMGQAQRAVLIAAPEVLRLGLLLQASARAGFTRRVVDCALKQALIGGLAFAAGTALNWMHEATVRHMWLQMQSLEACAVSQSVVDQQCLLALYSGVTASSRRT